MAGAVAYIVSRFPHLPETFILREMVELERQGVRVHLYPLLNQRQQVFHADSLAFMERARELSLGRSLVAVLRAFCVAPVKLTRIWLRVVWDNRSSPGFLLRSQVVFPKAVLAAEQMRRDGVGHIHAHYATHPALAAWIVNRLTGIGYSITTHAHDIFVDRAMLRRKVQDASFVVTISEFNQKFMRAHLGARVSTEIAVVRCGIVPEHYRPAARNGGSTRFELLTIASLQPYKGLRHLLQAYAELLDQQVDFHARIVGEGKERDMLMRMVRELGLEGRVELMGGLPQETIAHLLPEADCYVQPSVITPTGKMEGIPVSLMEALACEVPVVATAISGIPELVEPGVTGSLVPPGDASALARAIMEVAREPERFAALAAAGRRRVLAEFDLKRNVAQLARRLEAHGVGPLPDPEAARKLPRPAA